MTPSTAPPISDAVAVDVLRRVDRLLARIDDALDGRPKGKLRHRALSTSR